MCPCVCALSHMRERMRRKGRERGRDTQRGKTHREVERRRDRYQATYFLIENELKTGLNALFFYGFPK